MDERKGESLGMEHTSFANPSGLDEMGHSSCALDMARLAAYAMQNPTFARIVSTRTASVGTRTMTNHNKLLASYSGCVGLKTGYTGDAGRTLVTCAERGGMRMIAVTLHDGSDWADHAALYDYGFSAYALSSGAKKGEAYGSVSVDGQSVSAVAAESFRYPTAENEALSVRAELPQTVSAPVRKGQTFGTLVISCGETEVGRVDLVSARSVQAQETKSETSKISRWRKSSGNFCRQSKGGIDLAEARIQKLIAESGLCSRRTAEQCIAAGRVHVNGKTALLGQKADPKSTKLPSTAGRSAQEGQKRYLMLNKPRGYVWDIRFALEAKEDGSGNVTEYREMITPMEPGVLWVLPAIGESR